MSKPALDIGAEITRLDCLSIDSLREEWRRLHQTPPPRRLSRTSYCAGSRTGCKRMQSVACPKRCCASCKPPLQRNRPRTADHDRRSSRGRDLCASGMASRTRSSSWRTASSGAASATGRCRLSHARSRALIGRGRGSSASKRIAPMAKGMRVEAAQVVFAKVTAVLEDTALIAAEQQEISELNTARRSCDSLIARLEAWLRFLHRLRRRLA